MRGETEVGTRPDKVDNSENRQSRAADDCGTSVPSTAVMLSTLTDVVPELCKRAIVVLVSDHRGWTVARLTGFGRAGWWGD